MLTFLKFSKMHALGNDFVIIDRLTHSFFIDPTVIKSLANRKTGIGFDQLLVLEPPLDPHHDFSYQVFNSNGTQAKQCLNGLRCLAQYVHDHGLHSEKTLRMQTHYQSITCEILSASVVKLYLGSDESSGNKYIEKLSLNSGLIADYVTVGNDHIICWDVVKDEKTKKLNELKTEGYTNDKFNISFANKGNNIIFIETFERGVGKTLSCGSAAVACFIAYSERFEKITSIRLQSQIGYVTVSKQHENICMIGPVTRVFNGEFTLRYY
jgi:diaminopimelate epimerase